MSDKKPPTLYMENKVPVTLHHVSRLEFGAIRDFEADTRPGREHEAFCTRSLTVTFEDGTDYSIHIFGAPGTSLEVHGVRVWEGTEEPE